MFIRQLMIGGVSALVLISAVHAEDAVVADEFEQQQAVGACDAYGTGFAKLPGTNTCVKVSGQVRYEKHFGGGSRNRDGGQVLMDIETRTD